MIVMVWCELVCATCAAQSEGMFSRKPVVPRTRLIQAAKADGWTIQGDEPYCARCSKKGDTDGK